MAPPLPGSPDTAGKIAGAIALAFTGAPNSAGAQGPEPATQRPGGTSPTQPTPTADPAPTETPTAAEAPESTPPPVPGERPPPPATPDPGASDPAPTTTVPSAGSRAPATDPVAFPDARDIPPPRTARPEDSGLFRATDRRFFFQLFMGGRGSLLGGNPYSYYTGGGLGPQIELSIGGHGRVNREAGGAFVFEKTFGGYVNDFTVAGRFVHDKQLHQRFAVFSSHAVTAGFRAKTFGPFGLFAGGVGYFGGSLEYSWGVTAIMAERISLSFRPVNVELAGPGFGTPIELNLSVMGGLGTVW